MVSFVRSSDGNEFLRRFATYFFVGGISAVIDLTLFYIGITPLGLHYLAAGTISFVVATGINYVLCVRFVFNRGRRSKGKLIFLVYLVSGVGILVNLFVLGTLIEFFGIDPILAKIAAIGTTFLWNFGARNYLVFGR